MMLSCAGDCWLGLGGGLDYVKISPAKLVVGLIFGIRSFTFSNLEKNLWREGLISVKLKL